MKKHRRPICLIKAYIYKIHEVVLTFILVNKETGARPPLFAASYTVYSPATQQDKINLRKILRNVSSNIYEGWSFNLYQII